MGLDDVEIEASRRASAADAKTDALLKLAAAVVDRRGAITDEEFRASWGQRGISDGEFVEVVANVALNVFRNYFALVAGRHAEQPDAVDDGASSLKRRPERSPLDSADCVGVGRDADEATGQSRRSEFG